MKTKTEIPVHERPEYSQVWGNGKGELCRETAGTVNALTGARKWEETYQALGSVEYLFAIEPGAILLQGGKCVEYTSGIYFKMNGRANRYQAAYIQILRLQGGDEYLLFVFRDGKNGTLHELKKCTRENMHAIFCETTGNHFAMVGPIHDKAAAAEKEKEKAAV